MTKTAGIAGAGLVGRILALALVREGWSVSIFDEDDAAGRKSCGYVAGGMLSLYSEAECISDLVVDLGERSMLLWPEIVSYAGASSCFRSSGSVIVAHRADLSDLERRREFIQNRFPGLFDDLKIARGAGAGLSVAYSMKVPGEGSINNMMLFECLERTLRRHKVCWHCNTKVTGISHGKIVTEERSHVFDFVFDCRGIGAKSDLPGLRGVRGESILLRASNVSIENVVRVVHPRYSIYIVPRPVGIFLVGATEIESCDFSEMSVQSTLEILSAAYSLHRGFAEARIISMMTACRPAFSDNMPRIMWEGNAVRINGLYRYGYLCVPAMVEEVVRLLKGKDARYSLLHHYV